jgi:hypothetical protein
LLLGTRDVEHVLRGAVRHRDGDRRPLGWDPARARQLRQGAVRQPPKADSLRARADGGQQTIRGAGTEHQVVAGQRFFQRFQETVGRVRVHGVRVVDHDHAGWRFMRPRAGEGDDGADVVDDQLSAGAGRCERGHVGVRAGFDTTADLARATASAGRHQAV